MGDPIPKYLCPTTPQIDEKLMIAPNQVLFVLSGPSGVGKTSISREVLKIIPELKESISFTSRKCRKNRSEKECIDYYFITEEEFKLKIRAGDFLEWVQLYANYYGTAKSEISSLTSSGNNVLLVIDVHGAKSIKEQEISDTVFIFITPPSLEVLKNRLIKRDSDSPEGTKQRIKNANYEMSFQDRYDYVIVNNEISDTIQKLRKIIKKEEKKRH